MKTNIASSTSIRRAVRKNLGSAIVLAATALLLQGCTTAKPAWSATAAGDPLSRSPVERMDTREGIALVSFNF